MQLRFFVCREISTNPSVCLSFFRLAWIKFDYLDSEDQLDVAEIESWPYLMRQRPPKLARRLCSAVYIIFGSIRQLDVGLSCIFLSAPPGTCCWLRTMAAGIPWPAIGRILGDIAGVVLWSGISSASRQYHPPSPRSAKTATVQLAGKHIWIGSYSSPKLTPFFSSKMCIITRKRADFVTFSAPACCKSLS